MKIFKENSDSLVKKAAKLNLQAAILAESIKGGNFKSVNRGQGIEFRDVRDYLVGDNVRSIDWNVTARMGRPFIKQYEEDRELTVFFVFDQSLSMYCGSKGKSRLETAAETASLLLLASYLNGASVGAVLFDGKIRFSCNAKSGNQQVMMILSKFVENKNECEKGSVLSNALMGAHKLLKKRSLVFVISDFRTSSWQKNLALLASKNDVVPIRITDPLDRELPQIGTASFFDIESGKIKKFPTSSKKFQAEWFESNRKQLDNWKEFCVRHGAFPLTISTEEEPLQSLNRFFATRGKK